MLNRQLLMGRLVKDPELKHTASNIAVASFTIAVDRDFRDKDSGEYKTDFFDIVAWRQTAEFICQHFHKGDLMAVDGKTQFRDWTDKNGNKRRNAEVIADHVYFAQNSRSHEQTYTEYSPNDDPYTPASFTPIEEDDGTLPF